MPPSIHSESHLRSVLKGVSYRCFGTLFTTALSFVMTRSTKTALLLGAAEFSFKVILFWGHERVWAKVRWGRHHHLAPAVSPAPSRGRAPSAELLPGRAPPVLSRHAPPAFDLRAR